MFYRMVRITREESRDVFPERGRNTPEVLQRLYEMWLAAHAIPEAAFCDIGWDRIHLDLLHFSRGIRIRF